MSNILLVSTDAHTGAPPGTFRPYLEKRYHELLGQLNEEHEQIVTANYIIATFPHETLDLIDSDNAWRSGGLLGSWDVERRLEEMDREGVAAELLINGAQNANSPFFGPGNRPWPPDVRAAGGRAYHRWLADCMAAADGRLFAIADPGPCLNLDEAIKELRWVADHGFRSVSVPGVVADAALPPLQDEYYEPFWKACVDLGLVLSVHAGHGLAQGAYLDFINRITRVKGKSQAEILAAATSIDEGSGSAFELSWTPLQVAWNLMLSGAFDRYPELQLALTEVRADWAPAALSHLDNRFEHGELPLKKRPSDYWRENCWVGVSSIKQSEVRLRHDIGVERMMFGRDYPHPEGTWPNTLDWLRDALADVPEVEARLILGENAVQCYGLDHAKLRKVADRIGPRSSDVLGHSGDVDPRLVENFDQRGGYKKSAEHIDVGSLAELLERDLASAGGR